MRVGIVGTAHFTKSHSPCVPSFGAPSSVTIGAALQRLVYISANYLATNVPPQPGLTSNIALMSAFPY